MRGGDVSVSFSITFRTPDIERRSDTHDFNAYLRRNGLKPVPLGKHPLRDLVKCITVCVGRKVQRFLGEIGRRCGASA